MVSGSSVSVAWLSLRALTTWSNILAAPPTSLPAGHTRYATARLALGKIRSGLIRTASRRAPHGVEPELGVLAAGDREPLGLGPPIESATTIWPMPKPFEILGEQLVAIEHQPGVAQVGPAFVAAWEVGRHLEEASLGQGVLLGGEEIDPFLEGAVDRHSFFCTSSLATAAARSAFDGWSKFKPSKPT